MAALQEIKIAAGTALTKYGLDGKDYYRVITSATGTPTTFTQGAASVSPDSKDQTYVHETPISLNAHDVLLDNLGNVYLAKLNEPLDEISVKENGTDVIYLVGRKQKRWWKP